MENEDTKYSDRAKQVEENVINKSKMVEEFVKKQLKKSGS